jgi:hypothetical protein
MHRYSHQEHYWHKNAAVAAAEDIDDCTFYCYYCWVWTDVVDDDIDDDDKKTSYWAWLEDRKSLCTSACAPVWDKELHRFEEKPAQKRKQSSVLKNHLD